MFTHNIIKLHNLNNLTEEQRMDLRDIINLKQDEFVGFVNNWATGMNTKISDLHTEFMDDLCDILDDFDLDIKD